MTLVVKPNRLCFIVSHIIDIVHWCSTCIHCVCTAVSDDDVMCCVLAGVSYVVKSVTLRTLCQLTMCASHVTPYVTVAMALMPTSARPVKTLGKLYMQCVDFQKMFPLGKSCAWVDHFWLPKTRPPPRNWLLLPKQVCGSGFGCQKISPYTIIIIT